MHERSTFLMWQSASQTVLSALLIISASPIAGAIGPGNWYILGAGLSVATLIMSVFFVAETRYNRSLAAYGQLDEFEGDEFDQARAAPTLPVKMSERPALDFVRYQPRTLKSDMRIFVGDFDWMEGWYGLIVSLGVRCYNKRSELTLRQNTFQILLFPNVLWAFCLNGLTM
jgi:hypothetical protein